MLPIALVSENISKEFEKVSKIKTYSLKSFENLDIPVSSHADMLICKIDNNIFCYEKYYKENKELFEKIKENGYNIIRVKKECKKEYPDDISLNVFIAGKKIFCKKDSTAKEILDYAGNNGYSIINVRQGYSACSSVLLDEHHAITTDKSMEKTLKKEKIDAVYINTDKIILPGYNCGFIGGASGVYDKTFYIFGNVENIDKDGKIKNLLKELNFEKKEITSAEVYDFGGIKFI